MSTRKRNKIVLTLVAVAMVVLAVGQVQAGSIEINGKFEMYKPGTDILVVDLGEGNFWVNGIGMNLPLSNGGPVTYDDGTTGTQIDCPGWTSPITLPAWRNGTDDITTGQNQLFQSGYEEDGSTCINAFTGWSGQNGTLAESAESLGDIIGGATYTLAAMVSPQNVAPSGPLTLELMADGVIIPPSSEVTPTPESQVAHTYQVISRTYDAATTAPYQGQALTIRVGTTPPVVNSSTDPGYLVGQRVQFDNITLDVDPYQPSPGDGESVLTSENLELSWTNLPGVDSNDVYVDVWFGTEPNEMHPDYDMTLVVEALINGENAESVLVDASEIGTYYWRINSYLNGPDKINDANMVEGDLLLFYAVSDVAPTVVIETPDMMTWSGEGVPLVATVTDDDVSEVTIEWSAETDPVADIEITDGGTATPTVTINKLPYSEAKITNPGFEAVQGGDGFWGAATGWGGGGNWNPGDAPPPAGYEGLGDGYTGSAVPEGNMCGWTSGTLSQVLSETLAADTEYELTVQVGNSKTYEWTGYNVQFVAGGTVLAEDPNLLVVVPFDSWALVTVQFDSAGVDPDLVGQPLEIRLSSLQLHTADYSELNFDDVKLTANPPFPVPAVQTVTMTVTVGDEGNPEADTASMEIDVYDDACQMARVAEGKDDPFDFDENCEIGLGDLDVIVSAWLDDIALTAAAPASLGGDNIFSLSFYRFPGWMDTAEERETILLEADQAAGLGDWLTTGWINIETPWAPTPPGTPMSITSTGGSTATFTLHDTRNGGPYGGEARTTMLGDGNADMMDGHANGTVDPGDGTCTFDMEVSDIPFNFYEVIVYMGTQAAQAGDGEGRITFNGAEKNFIMAPGGFAGTFTEIVNEGDTGNYLVYTGLTDPNFTMQVVGTGFVGGTEGFVHLGPCGFQIREVTDPNGPDVDAGDDWITWLGEPVTMNATVTDRPGNEWNLNDLAYSWTATSVNPVEITGDDTLTPTVTVDPSLFVVNVPNPSFEMVTAQSAITTSRDTWGHYDRPAGGTAYALQYVPNTTYHFPEDENTPPDGSIICRTATAIGESRPDGLAMLLDEPFNPSANYTLTVAVGHPHAVPDHPAYNDDTWRGYLVQLVAGGEAVSTGTGADNISGGTVIAEDANSIDIARRTWETSTVTYTPSPAFDALAGEPLQIRLLAVDDPDPEYFSQTKVFYDNVKLITDAPTATLPPVNMTLTVEEVGTGKIANAYATIDVYNTPCDAGAAANPEMGYDLSDLNEDCITNLKDSAILGTKWLENYSSPGPLERIEEE